MGIVDRDHEGPARREVGGEPVEAVEDGEGRVVGRRLSELAREQRTRGRRRSGQELPALSVLRARQPSLEELTYHAEREARLELRPACPQHLTPVAFRPPARGVEQRRLADARPALDDEDATSFQHRLDRRQFPIALQQLHDLTVGRRGSPAENRRQSCGDTGCEPASTGPKKTKTPV